MIGLLQRVTHASVSVDSQTIGAIERGLLVFIGIEQADDESVAKKLLDRLLTYRVFPDIEGRMNRSLSDIEGGLLLVPQFTLAADTRKGTRPSFSSAAAPEQGRRLFDCFVLLAHAAYPKVATGRFGANMQINLTNDGPVTFWLQVNPAGSGE